MSPAWWAVLTTLPLGIAIGWVLAVIIPDWVDEWRERKARRRRAKRVRVVDNAVVRAWERRTRKS